MSNKAPDFLAFQADLRTAIQRIPRVAGAQAVRFFQDNFRRQGWVYNGKLKAWKKRSKAAKRNKGRAILIDTGRMRRSIRVLSASSDGVLIGTTVPYAEAHNEGSVFNGSVKVPGFTRKGGRVMAYKRAGKRIKAHQRSAAKVQSHTRQMNTTIPQRQFIGHSPDVLQSVERALFRDMERMIGKHLNRR